MAISLDLTDSDGRRLAEVAAKLGIAAEELAAAAVRDMVNRQDPDFTEAAANVLEKNRELYRRLS